MHIHYSAQQSSSVARITLCKVAVLDLRMCHHQEGGDASSQLLEIWTWGLQSRLLLGGNFQHTNHHVTLSWKTVNYLGELFYCTVTSWEAEKKHRRLSLKRQSGRKKLSIKTMWNIGIQKLQVVITSASCMNPQPQECMVAGLVLRPQCLDSRDLGSGHWLVPAAPSEGCWDHHTLRLRHSDNGPTHHHPLSWSEWTVTRVWLPTLAPEITDHMLTSEEGARVFSLCSWLMSPA